MSQLVTMIRQGITRVEHEGDRTYKCGANLDDTHIRWRVEISGGPDALDQRGFVFDDDVLQGVISRMVAPREPFPSCEQLALRLCKQIADAAPRVRTITVHIGTGPDITAPMGMVAVYSRRNRERSHPATRS